MNATIQVGYNDAVSSSDHRLRLSEHHRATARSVRASDMKLPSATYEEVRVEVVHFSSPFVMEAAGSAPACRAFRMRPCARSTLLRPRIVGPLARVLTPKPVSSLRFFQSCVGPLVGWANKGGAT